MTSLLDIGDISRKVVIRGKEMEVVGISGETFLHLLTDFPEIQKVMAGAAHKIDPTDLMRQVPAAVAAIIAAATGTPGDKKAEARARILSLGEQTEILKEVWELTFPKGIGPFLEALDALKGVATVQDAVPDTPSPEQLKPSSPPDMQEQTSGATPQG